MYTEIKTFEDACKKEGITTDLPEVSMLPKELQKAVVSNYKLLIISKAIRGQWLPDWDNHSQWKYYPWFKMSSSGSSFSYGDYGSDYTISIVGSRLCFENREQAKYVGKQFIELYRDIMVIEK